MQIHSHTSKICLDGGSRGVSGMAILLTALGW
jgi:hypothetical protein